MAAQPQLPNLELARAEEFSETSAARVFLELAEHNMLLQQLATELNSRGLLDPNGGLCASTCITNVVGAMTTQPHNFRQFKTNSPEILEMVVRAYYEHTGLDARLGAFMPEMSEATLSIMIHLLQRMQYDSMAQEINISMVPSVREFQASRLFQSMRSDAIAIVSVHPARPRPDQLDSAHAIVVLKIDFDARKIYLSDPNLPNQVIKADFWFTDGANIQFQVPFTYGNQPVVPFEYHTFRRTFHDQG